MVLLSDKSIGVVMVSIREEVTETGKRLVSTSEKVCTVGAAEKQMANNVRRPMRPLGTESGTALIEVF